MGAMNFPSDCGDLDELANVCRICSSWQDERCSRSGEIRFRLSVIRPYGNWNPGDQSKGSTLIQTHPQGTSECAFFTL